MKITSLTFQVILLTINYRCTDNALADYWRQIIGRLPVVYFRTHLRSISHVVTIVKSQWYDGRFVTLLL